MTSALLKATKDSIIRDDSGTNRGSGKDPHNVVGLEGTGTDEVLIDFEAIPTGITSLAWAKLYMRRSTGSPPSGHDTPDNNAQLIPSRITGDWSEGNAGSDHLYSTANAVKWPGPAVTGALSARGSQPASGWWSIDVTEIVQSWIDGQTQKGIKLSGVGSPKKDVVFDSFQASDATARPYLELNFGSGTGSGTNQPPDKPPTPTITYGSNGTSFTITGLFTDPDGDGSPQVEAVFSPD